MNSLGANSARKQQQIVASCAQPLYCEHTEDWRKLKTGKTCRIGAGFWGTGDTKTSHGKERAGIRSGGSESCGLGCRAAGEKQDHVQPYPCSSRILDKGSWEICRGLLIVTEFGVAGGLAGV